MATGKALDGKPYAGNPHVRFDEGEVAPAATPRRGSLLYKKTLSRFFRMWGIVLLSIPVVTAWAKDIPLPNNIKWGDVWEGECVPPRSFAPGKGMGDTAFVAVVTNEWFGFEVVELQLTETKRIASASASTRVQGDRFEEYTLRAKALRERLEREFDVKFNDAPQKPKDVKHLWMFGNTVNGMRVMVTVTSAIREKNGPSMTDLNLWVISREAERRDKPFRATQSQGLRSALKRLFDVDFDSLPPNERRSLPKSWVKLEKPIEGLNERQFLSTGMPGRSNRLFGVKLRRVFGGDVSNEELKVAATAVLKRIETEAGVKVPGTSDYLRKMFARRNHGVAVPGDDPDIGGNNHFFLCQGKIGDIQVTIEYSEPRYAKRDGEFVLVAKGAVLVHFTRFGNTRD